MGRIEYEQIFPCLRHLRSVPHPGVSFSSFFPGPCLSFRPFFCEVCLDLLPLLPALIRLAGALLGALQHSADPLSALVHLLSSLLFSSQNCIEKFQTQQRGSTDVINVHKPFMWVSPVGVCIHTFFFFWIQKEISCRYPPFVLGSPSWLTKAFPVFGLSIRNRFWRFISWFVHLSDIN